MRFYADGLAPLFHQRRAKRRRRRTSSDPLRGPPSPAGEGFGNGERPLSQPVPGLPLWGRWQPAGLTDEVLCGWPRASIPSEVCKAASGEGTSSDPLRGPPSPTGEGFGNGERTLSQPCGLTAPLKGKPRLPRGVWRPAVLRFPPCRHEAVKGRSFFVPSWLPFQGSWLALAPD